MNELNQLQIQQIPVKQISPSILNPRRYINESDLQQFAEDIKNDGGIQQPLKLRIKDKDKYEIVYGERRYRAAIINKMETVPAFVVEMDNPTVEKEQLIENANRQDVHFMDEGAKFSNMINRKVNPWPVDDVAKLVNRPVHYVLQRAELSNLTDKLQKDAWAGKIGIGFCIEMARLPKDAQTFLHSKFTGYRTADYGNVKILKEMIEKHIKRNLKTAKFDTTDATIDPKAGPCTTCPKRTGANNLFGDIKSKDICMDSACFVNKTLLATLVQIDNVIDKHPNIVFVKYPNSDIHKLVLKKLQSRGIKEDDIKSQYDFGSSNSKGSTATKVFFVDNDNLGRFTTLYKQSSSLSSNGKSKAIDVKELKKTGKAKAAEINAAIDENIKGIKERQKRYDELDNEKIWLRIHNEIAGDDKWEVPSIEFTKEDMAAIMMAMYTKTMAQAKINKVFDIKGTSAWGPEKIKLLEAFKTATLPQFRKVCRIFLIDILDAATGSHKVNANLAALEMFFNQYHSNKIKSIEEEQSEEAAKRKARADDRIATLKKQKVTEKTIVKK